MKKRKTARARKQTPIQKLRQADWKTIKTLTIQNCDPDGCPFVRCPMHDGSNNPFQIKDDADESNDPSVLVLPCNKNPLLAHILQQLARQLERNAAHG